MDAGKELIHEERRVARAKDVKIVFVKQETQFYYFNVVDADGNLKYNGSITAEPSVMDDCSCPSFKNNNNDAYMASHAIAFQCKHIIAARVEFQTKFQATCDAACAASTHSEVLSQ